MPIYSLPLVEEMEIKLPNLIANALLGKCLIKKHLPR